jgi:hypothetical protein
MEEWKFLPNRTELRWRRSERTVAGDLGSTTWAGRWGSRFTRYSTAWEEPVLGGSAPLRALDLWTERIQSAPRATSSTSSSFTATESSRSHSSGTSPTSSRTSTTSKASKIYSTATSNRPNYQMSSPRLTSLSLQSTASPTKTSSFDPSTPSSTAIKIFTWGTSRGAHQQRPLTSPRHR